MVVTCIWCCERERGTSAWVDHPECMSESMPCEIAVGLHARMCEWGVSVFISNKTTTSNSNDQSFPDTWLMHTSQLNNRWVESSWNDPQINSGQNLMQYKSAEESSLKKNQKKSKGPFSSSWQLLIVCRQFAQNIGRRTLQDVGNARTVKLKDRSH